MGAVKSSGSDTPQLSNRTRADRWRVEFPYGWDADDVVSRRHLLQWAVMTSGALFAATGVLAAFSLVRDKTRGGEQRIIEASAVPAGGVHYFEYPEDDAHAILLHLDDGQFVAFSGKCTHLSCAVYWNPNRGELVCPCHNGVFDPRTGEVIAGPPSRPLPRIALRQDAGVLYAVEETLE